MSFYCAFDYPYVWLLAQSCELEQHKCDYHFSDLVHFRNWTFDLVSFFKKFIIIIILIDRYILIFFTPQCRNDFYLALRMSFSKTPRLLSQIRSLNIRHTVGDISKLPHFPGYPICPH